MIFKFFEINELIMYLKVKNEVQKIKKTNNRNQVLVRNLLYV